MNLIFRVLYVLIASYFRPHLGDLHARSRLTMRVWPNDLDTNLHMNNGRYLTIMDLGRFDLILRTGLLRLMLRQKSVPVLGAAVLRYRLPLDAWQKFDLETQVIGWDPKWIFAEQRFILRSGPKDGAVAAIGLVKGCFYDNRKKTSVPTSDILAALGMAETVSPPLPPHITAMMEADGQIQALTAQPNA